MSWREAEKTFLSPPNVMAAAFSDEDTGLTIFIRLYVGESPCTDTKNPRLTAGDFLCGCGRSTVAIFGLE